MRPSGGLPRLGQRTLDREYALALRREAITASRPGAAQCRKILHRAARAANRRRSYFIETT